MYVQKQAAAFSFGHTLFEKGNSISGIAKSFDKLGVGLRLRTFILYDLVSIRSIGKLGKSLQTLSD